MATFEESSLSSWAGPYVTEMLGRGEALASQPYQTYMGPLTAGQSGLQQQAYQGIGALSAPTNMGGFNPQSFTANDAQAYMSPYLQGALQPQYAAAQRQSDISAQNLQSQYGKAGAYGGSRQGVAEAELQRGLLDRMSGITGAGYQTAFEQAQNQFNTEQDRQMTAQQRTNQYGMDVLGRQQDAGSVQRAIEQQGIGADIAQFEQERDYGKNNTLFMQSLLQGLPLETQTYSYTQPSGLQSLAGGVNDVTSILDELSKLSGENTGTGPAGGYSQATQSAALQGQYDFYVAKGQTPAQAMASAKADLGITP